MEKAALLAFRGHDDVNRYRAMISLAAANLARHEEIMRLVEARRHAGVESDSNLDIARGRLALAKSNLITEEGNLHDATTQYVRTVGVGPEETMEELHVQIPLPSAPDKALEQCLVSSPRLNSVSQSVQSTLFALEEQKAKLRPRIDLRGGASLEDDTDGTIGRKDKAYVELALRFNIYDGSDKDTIRRFEELYAQSKAILRKTDREVSQALLVAYNDILSIERQLVHLMEHQKAAESMERAYRQQYELGRRSLLDLLDAQNECFQAQRSYMNALFSFNNAKASYLAEMGALVAFFNISHPDVPSIEELGMPRPEHEKDKIK